MMHRVKKEKDLNEGKWIGIGGKLEPGETPLQCVARETREETGLAITDFVMRGIIYFHSDIWESEKMYLYSATLSAGGTASTGGANPAEELPDCEEGILKWVPFPEIMDLNLWEGDKLFLPKLMAGENDINMTLRYEGDKLVYWGEDNE